MLLADCSMHCDILPWRRPLFQIDHHYPITSNHGLEWQTQVVRPTLVARTAARIVTTPLYTLVLLGAAPFCEWPHFKTVC